MEFVNGKFDSLLWSLKWFFYRGGVVRRFIIGILEGDVSILVFFGCFVMVELGYFFEF